MITSCYKLVNNYRKFTSFYLELITSFYFVIPVTLLFTSLGYIYLCLKKKKWSLVVYALICLYYFCFFYLKKKNDFFGRLNPFDVILIFFSIGFLWYALPLLFQQTKMIMLGVTLSQFYNILSFHKAMRFGSESIVTKSIKEIPENKHIPELQVKGIKRFLSFILSKTKPSLLYESGVEIINCFY